MCKNYTDFYVKEGNMTPIRPDPKLSLDRQVQKADPNPAK
jgi:hypothetical protein